MAEVAHAAGRHRRRGHRPRAGARPAAHDERLLRSTRTAGALRKGDPRGDRPSDGTSPPADDRGAFALAAPVVAVGPVRDAREVVGGARGGGRSGRRPPGPRRSVVAADRPSEPPDLRGGGPGGPRQRVAPAAGDRNLGRHRAGARSSRAPHLSAPSPSPAPAKTTTTVLALACMAAWLAAAAVARPVGIWLAISGAAVGLGGAVFVLDHAAARRSLRPSARPVLSGVAQDFWW